MSIFRLISFASLLVVLSVGAVFAEAIKVSIPEMECESCSSAIEDRLKQEKDITKISVDLKERMVTIYTVDSVKVPDDKIKALIKDAGFEAKSIERLQ